MASLRKLYSENFDLKFKGQTFEVVILTKREMQTLRLPLYMKSGSCHRMTQLRMFITFIYIFTVTNFEMKISQKL